MGLRDMIYPGHKWFLQTLIPSPSPPFHVLFCLPGCVYACMRVRVQAGRGGWEEEGKVSQRQKQDA